MYRYEVHYYTLEKGGWLVVVRTIINIKQNYENYYIIIKL